MFFTGLVFPKGSVYVSRINTTSENHGCDPPTLFSLAYKTVTLLFSNLINPRVLSLGASKMLQGNETGTFVTRNDHEGLKLGSQRDQKAKISFFSENNTKARVHRAPTMRQPQPMPHLSFSRDVHSVLVPT